MAHLQAINASMYSDLSFVADLTINSGISITGYSSIDTVPELIEAIENDVIDAPSKVTGACAGLFTAANLSAGKWKRIKDVREFPAMGTPPNIVNVPVYGQKTSQQIQGQADAPSLEIQINYVADDWAKTGESSVANKKLGDFVGDGKVYIFRFAMMAQDPGDYDNTSIAAVDNTEYFFLAKLEALQVTPQLTDANTCTLTLSLQSDFYGPTTQGA